MNIEYTIQTSTLFAQAYGTSTYGAQEYSCQANDAACIAGTTTAESAPNTGFLGLSQDAAIASAGGALLVALAVIGIVSVVIARARRKKSGV